MFLRSATRRELLSLARAMAVDPPANLTPAAKRGTPEYLAGQKAYKILVVDTLRKEMLSRGMPVVLEGLRQPDIRAAIEIEMRKDLKAVTTEEELISQADEMNLNIFSVAEKDFLQLAHGTYGKLIVEHKGVECLLGGIILALCYQTLPKDKSMTGFVTRVLTAMLPAEVWSNALKLYGPVHKAQAEIRARRSHTVVRSVCLFINHVAHLTFGQDKIAHPGKAGKGGAGVNGSPSGHSSAAHGAHHAGHLGMKTFQSGPTKGTALAPIASGSTLLPPASLALFDEGPQEPFCTGCRKVCAIVCISLCL
jgi:hypothetical protein